LYVIVRSDLAIPQIMVQASHAAVDFQHQHPQISKDWNSNSNYLIILSVESEEILKRYIYKFQLAGLCHVVFREPDLGNSITAVCVQPSEKTQKIVSHLPLALGEYINEPLTKVLN